MYVESKFMLHMWGVYCTYKWPKWAVLLLNHERHKGATCTAIVCTGSLVVLTAHTSTPSQHHSQAPECQASCMSIAFFAGSLWYLSVSDLQSPSLQIESKRCVLHAQIIECSHNTPTLYCLARTALAFLWVCCLAARTVGVRCQAAHQKESCWTLKQAGEQIKHCEAPHFDFCEEQRRLIPCFGCQTRSQVRRCTTGDVGDVGDVAWPLWMANEPCYSRTWTVCWFSPYAGGACYSRIAKPGLQSSS